MLASVAETRTTYRGRTGPGVSAQEGRATNDERPCAATPDLPVLHAGPRSPTRDPPVTEALLARLWAGQRLPATALVTVDGAPLRVLHPGWPVRGAGPDFRDAVVATPQRVLRGDIELHLRESDFRAHGHHTDRRYDRVVLHVVFESDGAGATRLRSGREVPVIALAPWVRRRSAELAGWLQSPALWREPCHDALLRLGPERVAATLAALGDARLEARIERLSAHIEARGAGEALYRALLEAISFGGERAPFERVAAGLPLADVLAARDIEAELLAVAGTFAQARGRPANHPARRLAGLARLVARHRSLLSEPPELASLRQILERRTPALVASWCVDGPPALIGRSRAIELLVNAVLPWAAALGEPEVCAAALEAYARLPRPAAYGSLAFLEENLRAGRRSLVTGARQQQGLLALYKSQCTKGGCGRCQLS
jgi:hypothetical protein